MRFFFVSFKLIKSFHINSLLQRYRAKIRQNSSQRSLNRSEFHLIVKSGFHIHEKLERIFTP